MRTRWALRAPVLPARFLSAVRLFISLSFCASRPHTCSTLCSDWTSRKAMSSYWLKIASRAEAKNRRIYKPRRFTETRCTYAAVAGKVGALREI